MEEDEEGVCHPALLSEGMRWSWDTIQGVKGTPGFCRWPGVCAEFPALEDLPN